MIDCYWSFYNQRSRARYDGFKTAQARGFVTAIPVDQASEWIVWKEGYPDWKPLALFQELFPDHAEFSYAAESEFNLNSEEDYATNPGVQSEALTPSHTVTNTKSLSGKDPNEPKAPKTGEATSTAIVGEIVPEDNFINISELNLELGATPDVPRPDMRKSARTKRVLDVEVNYGAKKPLLTKSIDLSIGGVLLELHLPATAKKTVRMTLKRGTYKVEAVAENILDKHGFPSRRYRFLTVDLPDLVRTWLLT